MKGQNSAAILAALSFIYGLLHIFYPTQFPGPQALVSDVECVYAEDTDALISTSCITSER